MNQNTDSNGNSSKPEDNFEVEHTNRLVRWMNWVLKSPKKSKKATFGANNSPFAPEEVEEEDLTPYPRSPPQRSFQILPFGGVRIDAEKYAAHSLNKPRYGSYDYRTQQNDAPWSDEEGFYQWLLQADIPRELAEMLYYHAPEVSFMLGPGSISGVASIIDDNDKRGVIGGFLREPGFFQMASCPNGDFIVIDLLGERKGEVGYLGHEGIGDSPAEIRSQFIPIIDSIGNFFEACESGENRQIPRDYYQAREMRNQGDKHDH